MKTKNNNMVEKLELTVQKTEIAIDRIRRFVTKYAPDLNNNQVGRMSTKLQELQKEVDNLVKKHE